MLTTRAVNKLNRHQPFFDVSKSEYAYLFGLLQTDGCLSEGRGSKGKLTLEIQSQDAVILPALQGLFPCNTSVRDRVRFTNFKDEYHSCVLTVSDLGTREELKQLGLPVGKKSDVIAPPSVPYVAADYFRGIIDGDGSLGITSQGWPFVSLVTASENLATAYTDFLRQELGIEKRVNPNKRDGVYNLMVTREHAQALVSRLYYEGCLAIPRKVEAAARVIAWERPATMRKRTHAVQRWTPEQDAYIQAHSVEESAAALGRTPQSIKMRLWRIESGRVTD